MKIKLVLLSTLIGTIGLTVPVTAQIRNPSQDFFDRGREQLEREIQSLQGASVNLEENLKKPSPEPLLEVSPSPANPPSETPNEVETPSQPQPPNEVDRQQPENQN